MRIAFLNRGRVHPGGDLIALDATMAALRHKGVECEETGWHREAIQTGGFDLCHIFHCNFDWSYGNWQAVQESLMPRRLASGWTEVMTTKGYVLTPVWYPGLYSGVTKDQVSDIVMNARMVLPFSRREGQEMRDELGWFPYEPIPNGTDPMFHCTTPASEREGVLCVSARGESDKNIPLVREACAKLGIPFTCATGIPHDQMPAVYAKHRVFVNASDSERMSLTVGEALCAGCRVIDNTGNRGTEHYKRIARFDPKGSGESFSEFLSIIYKLDWWGDQSNEDARALTWDLVASRLIQVYRWAMR